MKKQNLFHIVSCLLASAVLLTGCGKSKDLVLYGSEADFGKAELCDYSNLSVTKNVYEISDDMVDRQIDSLIEENVDYKPVDRPAQSDDILTLSLTLSSGGEVLYDFTEEEDKYELNLGYEEFGEEFDKKLTGAKAGDHLKFSVDYDEDSDFEDFAGKTVDFDVTVDAVTIEETPQLTPEYIKNTLGYDSEDALRKGVRDDLEAQFNQTSEEEMKQSLLEQIIEGSTFGEYSAESINSYKASIEESYASYMEMFGASTLPEIYEMFGITEEDIADEALEQAKRDTVINQIGREQDIRVPQKEYDEYVQKLATEYEYESSADMIADYGEDAVKAWLLEEKVFEYLSAHATITENKTDASLLNDFGDGEDMGEEDEEALFDDSDFEPLGDDEEDFDDGEDDDSEDADDTEDDDADAADEDDDETDADDGEDDGEDDAADEDDADEADEADDNENEDAGDDESDDVPAIELE